MSITDESTSETPAAPDRYGALLGGTDHKSVGTFCLVVAFLFLLAGVGMAEALRTQFAAPDLSVLASKPYLQLMTLHGTFSFFLFLLPAWIGIGFAVVPLQLGAPRLALPRVGSLTDWLFGCGGGVVAASAFVDGGAARNGWSMDFP